MRDGDEGWVRDGCNSSLESDARRNIAPQPPSPDLLGLV